MVIGWTNKREGKDCGRKEGRRIYGLTRGLEELGSGTFFNL
jgi:hypothetical protein